MRNVATNKRWNISLWPLLALWLGFLLLQPFAAERASPRIAYSQFKQAIAEEAAKDLDISSSTIQGKIRVDFLRRVIPDFKPVAADEPWQGFTVDRVDDPDLVGSLDQHKIVYRGVPESGFLKLLGIWIFPLLLMLLLWRLMFAGGGAARSGGILGIGKSKARVYVDKDIAVRFKDVAGIDEAVAELREVVDFLTQPGRYTRLGGRLPKGVLLVGPPGTGKTLLARAVAGEAKVPFFSLSGSEFVEMFVGVGAARVRDLFEQAQRSAPCIIFIDELDALGRARSLNATGSNEEREQTLNQLLTEMDGFDPNSGVVLMAATNRPEILDPALLRAGRFDRHVVVDRPDVGGREAILRLHAGRVVLAGDVDLKVLAARTPGFVGADLANVVNEGALLAARVGKVAVAMADFEEAIERVLGGPQKKSTLMTAREKHRTAFHESGHALAAILLEHADPVHKISIIPRGIAALGYTLQMPGEERHIHSRQELLDRICVLYGGRASEEIVFGDLSTGAADDLQKATQMARRLVIEFGMSRLLGPVAYAQEASVGFRVAPSADQYSQEIARLIDEEVLKISEELYERVRLLLRGHEPALRELAALLERQETVDGDTARAIVEGRWTETGGTQRNQVQDAGKMRAP